MEWNFQKSPVNDSDFRWNWAKANVDPSYKPQGPGIGSLLMSLNPNTQQQGLQQINDDMARDTAARDAVLKQGAAENKIINELYNQDMDMKKLLDSQEKSRNAEQGHKNAAMDLAMRALATNDPGQIAAARFNLENQYGKEYADQIMATAEQNKKLTDKQMIKVNEELANFPGLYESDTDKIVAQRRAYKLLSDGEINTEGYKAMLSKIANAKTKEELRLTANTNYNNEYMIHKRRKKDQEKEKEEDQKKQGDEIEAGRAEMGY